MECEGMGAEEVVALVCVEEVMESGCAMVDAV